MIVRTFVRQTLVGLFALALGSSTPAMADATTAPRKIVTVEGISEYHLPNGLRVLLVPDPSRPAVTVNLTVLVGSRHEGYGEAGMAHLLEHMVFKGTPDHPKVPQALQARGAKFNGTTSLDRTNYFETLTANDENLEFAIRLEADRLVNSFIKKEDLASEMTVVRNEFERGENSPVRVLAQRMMSAAYEWHNYGQSTIGNRSDIERVPVEKLREFYQRFYQPDNVILVVAGRFDEAKALEYIEKYFGSLARPERKLDTTYTEEPAQDGERQVTLRRVGDVSVVGVVYHIPAGPHPDFAAIDVLESTLTTAPSGRLYKALVESQKATSVSGGAYALHDPGVIRFMAEVSKGNSPEVVLDTLLQVLEEVGKSGLTEKEVERAKTQLLKQRELSATDTSSIAVELSDWASQGDWRLYFLYRDRIEKVTPADVQRVALEYLKRNNRTVGVYIPSEQSERISVPATPDLAEMVKDYKGRQNLAVGEAFDVSPANIESRTRRLTLSGGTKVALLPKKTQGETVHLRIALRYGTLENLSGFAVAADYLPHLMLRGTQKLDRQELQDELDKYRVKLAVQRDTPAGTAIFSLQTTRTHFAQALELLRQVLREPSLPDDEFQILRRRSLAGLEQQRNDPDALAQRALGRKFAPYPSTDVRFVPTIEEDLERTGDLSLSQIKELYKGFLGAGASQVSVVGDFDPEPTVQLLANMLDDWRLPQSYARIPRAVPLDWKGGKEQILTPDKANAVYYSGQIFALRDDDPDYPALLMGDYVLGAGALSSRLGNRIRQREGLSYGVRSAFSADAFDRRATLTVFAICNPTNIGKVETAAQEEMALLLKAGPTADELARARHGFLQRQEVERSDDANLAQILNSTLYTGRTMDYFRELEDKISAVTVDQVAAAMRKHLQGIVPLIVTAGDFNAASSAAAK